MFLQHHGLLQKYMRLIATIEAPGKYSTLYEDAFDKNFEELVPMWRTYLNGLKARSAICDKMPWTEIFSTKEQFDEFYKANQSLLANGF